MSVSLSVIFHSENAGKRSKTICHVQSNCMLSKMLCNNVNTTCVCKNYAQTLV